MMVINKSLRYPLSVSRQPVLSGLVYAVLISSPVGVADGSRGIHPTGENIKYSFVTYVDDTKNASHSFVTYVTIRKMPLISGE
ncbi:MAG: hypothetical protein PHH91_00010 [Desulfuromonadaceae bacterium]|nr:hypothetical protein [Desulfuromonadaceae bacterium]